MLGKNSVVKKRNKAVQVYKKLGERSTMMHWLVVCLKHLELQELVAACQLR
jgi:hypothetical protein